MESERLIWVVVLGHKCLKMPVGIRVCRVDYYALLVLWKLCFGVLIEQKFYERCCDSRLYIRRYALHFKASNLRITLPSRKHILASRTSR
jgi:hypothetical protein